jgi:hypothetical protein
MAKYKQTEMKIFETTNYDLFKSNSLEYTSSKQNREVTKQGVKRAINNILSTKKKCVIPIVVNTKMEVIDGQHRLEACRELKVPVRFFKTKEIKQEMIPTLQGGKAWGLIDYVKSFAEQGVTDFQILLNSYNNRPLSSLKMGSLGVLYQGRSFSTAQLKNPNFKLTTEMKQLYKDNSQKVSFLLAAVNENTNRSVNDAIVTEKWMSSLVRFIQNKNVSLTHLAERLSKTQKTLPTSRQQAPIDQALCELYNEGSSTKIQPGQF